MMICLTLALTAQLICSSDDKLVCTDNGSIAQLIDVPACTSTEQGQVIAPETGISRTNDATGCPAERIIQGGFRAIARLCVGRMGRTADASELALKQHDIRLN